MSAPAGPVVSVSRRLFLQGTAAGAAGLWLGRGLPLRAEVRPAEVDRQLKVHTDAPMNAEPELDDLCKEWITPLRSFYIRSHAKEVPQIDPDEYRISIEGLVEQPLKISLAELQKEFRKTSAIATLTCAGNRRSEFEKKVSGVQWGAAAIGNARWGGARLSDVLRKAGLKEGAKYVQFESLDRIGEEGKTFPFGGSISLDKALDDRNSMPGALIAWEMNGQPLPVHHGFPARLMVPGYIGARSAKWLARIIVSDRPSENHFLTEAYRLVQEDTPQAWKQADPIFEYPLNGAICRPATGAKLKPGKITVRGYALATGEPRNTIERVQLRVDDGQPVEAKIVSANQPYAWVLWEAQVPVTGKTEKLTVRATDSAGHTQPDEVRWNLKGYLYNGASSVPVSVR